MANPERPQYVPFISVNATSMQDMAWKSPCLADALAIGNRYHAPWIGTADPLDGAGSNTMLIRSSALFVVGRTRTTTVTSCIWHEPVTTTMDHAVHVGPLVAAPSDCWYVVNPFTPIVLPSTDVILRKLQQIDPESCLEHAESFVAFENYSVLLDFIPDYPVLLDDHIPVSLVPPMHGARNLTGLVAMVIRQTSHLTAVVSAVSSSFPRHSAAASGSAPSFHVVNLDPYSFRVHRAVPAEHIRALIMHDALHNAPLPAPVSVHVLDRQQTHECMHALQCNQRGLGAMLSQTLSTMFGEIVKACASDPTVTTSTAPVPAGQRAPKATPKTAASGSGSSDSVFPAPHAHECLVLPDRVGDIHTLVQARDVVVQHRGFMHLKCTMMHPACHEIVPMLWHGHSLLHAHDHALLILSQLYRHDVLDMRAREETIWTLVGPWTDTTLVAAYSSAQQKRDEQAIAKRPQFRHKSTNPLNSSQSSQSRPSSPLFSSSHSLPPSYSSSLSSSSYTPPTMSNRTKMLCAALLKHHQKLSAEIWPKHAKKDYYESNHAIFRCRNGSVVINLLHNVRSGFTNCAGSWMHRGAEQASGRNMHKLVEAELKLSWDDARKWITDWLGRIAPDDMAAIDANTFAFVENPQPASDTSSVCSSLASSSSAVSTAPTISATIDAQRLFLAMSLPSPDPANASGAYALPRGMHPCTLTTTAGRYLHHTRGLCAVPSASCIRSVQNAFYSQNIDVLDNLDSETRRAIEPVDGIPTLRLDAVVLLLSNTRGVVCGHQYTYLNRASAQKARVQPVKRNIGKCTGNFAHIHEGDGPFAPVILAEGLETGLSFARAVKYAHVFVACGIENIGNFDQRQRYHDPRVFIAVDEDPIQAAARSCLHSSRIKLEKRGYTVVFIRLPESVLGFAKDANDLHRTLPLDQADSIVREMVEASLQWSQ